MRRILENNKNIKIFLEFFPLLVEKRGNSPQGLIEVLLKELGFNIYVVGGDYSMKKGGRTGLLEIRDYGQLQKYLNTPYDHISLYLSRESFSYGSIL